MNAWKLTKHDYGRFAVMAVGTIPGRWLYRGLFGASFADVFLAESLVADVLITPLVYLICLVLLSLGRGLQAFIMSRVYGQNTSK